MADNNTFPYGSLGDQASIGILLVRGLLTGPGVGLVFSRTNPNGNLQGVRYQLAVAVDTGVVYQNTDNATTWAVYNAGIVIPSGSLLIGTQKITANGTYTPTAGTTKVVVEACAAGGGGGGSAANGQAGGGASGWYGKTTIDGVGVAITGGAVAVGAAGAAGAAGQNVGGTGGDTSFVINGTTYTLRGGAGGQGGTAQASGVPAAIAGGLVGAAPTGTFDVAFAMPGAAALVLADASTTFVVLGHPLGSGGDCGPFGVGGRNPAATRSATNIPGVVGTGKGAGGSGAVGGAGTAAGGAGLPGYILINEYK